MSRSSSEFELVKRGFQEMLDLVGVDITCGNSGIKKCICGPIKEERHQEEIGSTHHWSAHIEMLAEDYADFDVELNKTEVTVNGVTMTIVEASTDPMDPAVHFDVRRDN